MNILGFALLGLSVPLFLVIVLGLFLLVICGSLVVCERLEAKGNTNLVRLLQTNALFHGHGGQRMGYGGKALMGLGCDMVLVSRSQAELPHPSATSGFETPISIGAQVFSRSLHGPHLAGSHTGRVYFEHVLSKGGPSEHSRPLQ